MVKYTTARIMGFPSDQSKRRLLQARGSSTPRSGPSRRRHQSWYSFRVRINVLFWVYLHCRRASAWWGREVLRSAFIPNIVLPSSRKRSVVDMSGPPWRGLASRMAWVDIFSTRSPGTVKLCGEEAHQCGQGCVLQTSYDITPSWLNTTPPVHVPWPFHTSQ